MKPHQDDEEKTEEAVGLGDENETNEQITGDVIGGTAYSERFVLKILLKFANLDSLKDELNEQSFEEDLCILWDMTAEKDVVVFLQKHDTLKLFSFALPAINSGRITEILIGIVGNMCCEKQVVKSLLDMNSFLATITEYLKSSDVSILLQVLRLINACLFLSDGEDIRKWLDKFEDIDYTNSLSFILQNSSNKDLLVNALENFNTICSKCNVEQSRYKFFKQFVNLSSFEALNVAFIEITTKQKRSCEKEEFERMIVITLQIILNLIGFDASQDIYKDSKEDITDIVHYIINYFEKKLVHKKQFDTDLVDIIDSIYKTVEILNLSEINDSEIFFDQSYNMWLTCSSILKYETNGTKPEESSEDSVDNFAKKLNIPLSCILCNYLKCCSQENLFKVLDKIGKDYNDIICACNDKDVKNLITSRCLNYRTRIVENVDS